MKLLIKYCGGCNPSINRKKVVDEVIVKLKQSIDVEIVKENADVGFIVGGCSVCCVNLDEVKDQARELVVLGGDLVDYVQIPPDQLTSEISQQILKKGGGRSC
ncbi:MAG: hypothetical protein U9N81_14785 [Bacillota bacterium]|nr:hypothetical protein [Bacillota bacterium]